jgi:hypothetical protein
MVVPAFESSHLYAGERGGSPPGLNDWQLPKFIQISCVLSKGGGI